MCRSVTVFVAVFLAALGCLIVLLAVGVPAARADGEAVSGSVVGPDRRPVVGVTVRVYAGDGALVGSATSGPDGRWTVPVPAAGTYQVELDVTTLPPGAGPANDRPSLTVSVYEGAVRTVIFPLAPAGAPGGGAPAGPAPAGGAGSYAGRVADLAYGGIHFGLIIALAALGLSLVFGTTGLTNFAHGEMVTFGAMVAFLLNVVVGAPLVAAAVVAVAAGAAAGWAQDRVFWGWLRRRRTGVLTMMIISIGVALVLRYAYLYLFGPATEPYADYNTQAGLRIGPVSVAPKNLILDGAAVVVLVAVSVALLTTRLGRATRAVADNPALAAASGVDADRIVRLVWTVGGGLAALSGVVLGAFINVNYQMGFQILLLVFAAVILGGLGTAFGALVGSLAVGLFIQLSTLVVPPELKNVGALVLLVVVLLVRPQGLLGRPERVG